MKDKRMIILTSVFTVLICLMLAMLLFFVVTPALLIILSFSIGVVTGVCITSFIQYFKHLFRINRSEEG